MAPAVLNPGIETTEAFGEFMTIPVASRDRLLIKTITKNRNVADDRLVCNSVVITIPSNPVNQATSHRD